MSMNDQPPLGSSSGLRPHAYDPAISPELFEGVLARRFIAFLIDLTVLTIPVVLAAVFIFILGIVTLGLGFAFYALFYPAMILWALFYCGITLGGPRSATLGMRVMDLEMRTWYGAPAYFVLGAAQAVVFWISVSVLTPFVLLVCLFNRRHRCLHDMLVGTIVINNAARARSQRGAGRPL